MIITQDDFAKYEMHVGKCFNVNETPPIEVKLEKCLSKSGLKKKDKPTHIKEISGKKYKCRKIKKGTKKEHERCSVIGEK